MILAVFGLIIRAGILAAAAGILAAGYAWFSAELDRALTRHRH